MNNEEAIQRIAKIQGNLMKLVANLESCKIILYGAYAPVLVNDDEQERMDRWLNDYQKK